MVDRRSSKTVAASRKSTPCFLKVAAAFFTSQVNVILPVYTPGPLAFRALPRPRASVHPRFVATALAAKTCEKWPDFADVELAGQPKLGVHLRKAADGLGSSPCYGGQPSRCGLACQPKLAEQERKPRAGERRLAERGGFEPPCRLRDKTLSRRPRYDHFGTSPQR